MPPSLHARHRHLVLEPSGDAPEELPIRVFRFPIGWVTRPDGVWDLHGVQSAERTHEQYDEILRWWSRVTRLPSGLLSIVGASRPPDLPTLPARAVCQRCRNVSELRADELRVSPTLPRVRLTREPTSADG